jgi:AbrB family looped-hinge helix DNA binding protein
MPTVTVSSKGQVVLPAELRNRLGLAAGARLEISEEADGLRLTRSAHTAGLVTFDRRFGTRAAVLSGAVAVECIA